MKKWMMLASVLMISPMSFAKLTAINCESNLALSLSEDRTEGTVSMVQENVVGVFTLQKVGGSVTSTTYEAAVPMMVMTIQVDDGAQGDGYREYNVKASITGEDGIWEEKYECTSAEF